MSTYRVSAPPSTVKLIYLTSEGRSFHSKAIEALEPAFRQMADEIDLSQLEDVLPVLETVRRFLDDNRDL